MRSGGGVRLCKVLTGLTGSGEISKQPKARDDTSISGEMIELDPARSEQPREAIPIEPAFIAGFFNLMNKIFVLIIRLRKILLFLLSLMN